MINYNNKVLNHVFNTPELNKRIRIRTIVFKNEYPQNWAFEALFDENCGTFLTLVSR